MSYVITKLPDGDVSLGNLNGEFVSLSDTPNDYATSGYPITGNEWSTQTGLPINCDLWRILTVVPVGGQGGVHPVWNPNTQKLQMWWNGGGTGADIEVPNGTDLSAYSFNLLIVGY